MNSSNGPWASYCFRQSNIEKEFRHPHLELQYDDLKSLDHHSINKRLKYQKQRVFNSTVRRVLMQKTQLDKERLFYHYSKGFNIRDLATQFQTEDLPAFMEFYDVSKESLDDQKLQAWFKRRVSLQNARKHAAHDIIAQSERVRPASADTYQRNRRRFLVEVRNENEEARKICCKKKERTRSAPASRMAKEERSVQMVSKATQDDGYYIDDTINQSRSGCTFCPVECRPVSSSSYDQRSSTGLQASPGPTHYQYFHYKKYFYYQRPMSAIGVRMDYLESSGKKESMQRIPHFSSFAHACTMHERDGSRGSPRSRSPRSPTSVATEPTRPRRAWTEDAATQDESELIFMDMEESEQDETSMKRDVPPPPSEDFDVPLALDEDRLLNDEVRHHAEQSYALASSDDRERALQQQTEDEREMTPKIDENAQDLFRDSRFVPITRPTPSPPSSTSESIGGGEIPPVKPTFHRPPLPESTDMLSGRVFVPGLDVPHSPEALYHVEEDAEVPPIVVEIEIRTPEPLPVKRIPEPDVFKVDVVSPREAFGDSEEPGEVSSHVSDKLEDDVAILTDRTVTISDVESIVEELTAVAVEKAPSSILKSGSEEKEPSKQPSRVSFNIVTPEEPVLMKPVLTESMIVASLKKDKQLKVEKVIPEVIFEDEPLPPQGSGAVHNASEVNSEHTAEIESALTGGGSSVVITTPESTSQKSGRSARLFVPPIYHDPDDEYLRKLLAPPDLGDFEPPVFDPALAKVKKKKKKGGGKKKIKGRKKKTTEKVPSTLVAEEPLFTYIKRADREVQVTAEPTQEMREETAEMQRVVSTVRQFDEAYRESWMLLAP